MTLDWLLFSCSRTIIFICSNIRKNGFVRLHLIQGYEGMTDMLDRIFKLENVFNLILCIYLDRGYPKEILSPNFQTISRGCRFQPVN